jgi:hypothetical protein
MAVLDISGRWDNDDPASGVGLAVGGDVRGADAGPVLSDDEGHSHPTAVDQQLAGVA